MSAIEKLKIVPPTTGLPLLVRLADHTTSQIGQALANLRALYFDEPVQSGVQQKAESQMQPMDKLLLPKRLLDLKHPIHDDSVPDSGYASDEEECCCLNLTEEGIINVEPTEGINDECDESFDIDVLRSDAFERAFVIKWLTGFISRSDVWLSPEAELDERSDILDEVSALLSKFAGEDLSSPGALTRQFNFLTDGETVEIEMNDAALLDGDHTSVGLQSWASAVIMAERICAEPSKFGLPSGLEGNAQKYSETRVLELGAGTGLLSIATGKLFQHAEIDSATIVATDYHPDVLENLRRNVETNFFSSSSIKVHALDWERPDFSSPCDRPFDVILAADVIYHPQHASWIKPCVEHLLLKPTTLVPQGGTFWMISAVRSVGRHEGMCGTVSEVFGVVNQGEEMDAEGEADWKLKVLSMEEIEKKAGLGRADEGGYMLFKIGWTRR